MNTKIVKGILALVLVLSALLISPSTALANDIIKIEDGWTNTGTLYDVCPFPVDYIWTVQRTYMNMYFDNSGVLIKLTYHSVDQDTFTANGKTLVGMPFSYSGIMTFDSDGNAIYQFMNGVNEKIRLPDGSLFIAAGRYDWNDHPGEWLLLTDKGNPGKLDKFCAALAPEP
jgi:hypothetical protein